MATFDPSQPFEVEGQPQFDPSKPFSAAPDFVKTDEHAKAYQEGRGVIQTMADAAKSIPRGLLTGFMDAGSASARSEAAQMGQFDLMNDIPDAEESVKILEKRVTGDLHQPETRTGKIVASGARALGNPASYVGPGSLLLKMGGAALSGAGSEAAGQAAEGTPLETPARVVGGLAGGIAGAKMLGPAAERAVAPTLEELHAVANNGYDAARNSGLTVSPKGISNFALGVNQELSGPKYGFTGGPNGVAPKTFAVLDDLQSAPNGAVVTASNLDALRKNLGHIAKETQLTGAGPKPTADAAAATIALRRLSGYMEDIPQADVLAGDANAYTSAIRQANGDYAAASRAETIGARLTKAENQATRARGVGFDDTIRTKLATILDNPKLQRGFSKEEIDAIQRVHDGTLPINIAKEVGKLGVKGALSLALHIGLATGTGGATIPIAVVGTLSRKIADALSRSKAGQLDEMVRMRSPEYAARSASVAPYDTAPNQAALARSMMVPLSTLGGN